MAKKKKVGRPAKDPKAKAVRVSISVPPEMTRHADKHFDGSMSALVHWLWERIKG